MSCEVHVARNILSIFVIIISENKAMLSSFITWKNFKNLNVYLMIINFNNYNEFDLTRPYVISDGNIVII